MHVALPLQLFLGVVMQGSDGAREAIAGGG